MTLTKNEESLPLLGHVQAEPPPKATPLPWMKLMLVSMVQFCEAFNGNSVFAYLGFMIVHFGLVKDVADAGFYSGFIGSSFFLCQFLTRFPHPLFFYFLTVLTFDSVFCGEDIPM
jgi:hypothetical protein